MYCNKGEGIGDKTISKQTSKMIKAIGLGFEITGIVIAGFLIGKWIGKAFELEDVGAITGIFLGFSVWVVHILFHLK